jgi:hypothetical protein
VEGWGGLRWKTHLTGRSHLSVTGESGREDERKVGRGRGKMGRMSQLASGKKRENEGREGRRGPGWAELEVWADDGRERRKESKKKRREEEEVGRAGKDRRPDFELGKEGKGRKMI